ncbi:MAG TPA: FAD-dependent oxidoreductase, partial [Pseudorhizobium sp.]|nr:FAD-dependent oxidoreductase [Pseudorhizobium sp.]
EGHVIVGDERIDAGCIVWGAGVKASPAFAWLGMKEPTGGRIPVDADLQVVGLSDIYAIGDTAMALDAEGKPLPALAQVAKQQGEFLGRKLRQGGPPAPFRFRNRGNTAVIGRHAAVFDFGRWTLKGRFAWLLWAVVHVYLLVNFEKRVLVTIQWIWRYLTRQRGARIIDEDASLIGDQKDATQIIALSRRQ